MHSNIRVLHVVADPSAAVWLVEPIARRQAAQGYQVEFVSGPGEYLHKLYELNYPVTVVPISRRLASFSHLTAIYSLWRLMRRGRYQVVHTHTPAASFIGRLAAALAGVPCVIYHMRTSWWDSPSRASRWGFTLLEKLASKWTAHIFTINCLDASETVARKILPGERVTCTHCGAGGVNTHRFDPANVSAVEQEALRCSLGIHPGDFVVGFIGRLVQEKGVLDLLEAFQQAVLEQPQMKLVFVGGVLKSERDQVTQKKIHSYLADERLASKVTLTGFRQDIPQLMAVMNVIVLPSYREGFGMVLAEAAAMGVPVISSDTRGGREAVLDGKNGLIVPIGDVEKLSQALTKLATSPELQCTMGQAGRQLAVERFAEQVVFERINRQYIRLLDQN